MFEITVETARLGDHIPKLLQARAMFRSVRFASGFWKVYRTSWPHVDLSHCSANGPRKLAAPRLANAGCSEREIMAITGRRSLSEVSRYTKAADQARLSEQAMCKMMKADTNSNCPTCQPGWTKRALSD